MMLPQPVTRFLANGGFGAVVQTIPVGGGCINNGARLETDTGTSFFLKINEGAPADMFPREAEGLEALRVEGAPQVPEPFLWGAGFILMEDLRPAPRRPDYWESFGRQLAVLHENHGERFGFAHDNYIGSTPQPNTWTEDGHIFFAHQRLEFQARLAHKKNLLNAQDMERVNRLAARLPDLVPTQPPSLIHGDLWSGNAVTGPRGEPAIIDPATHFGWAEADLAMTTLFGRFPESFYRAYEERRSLDPGWRGRLPLYNLYHLLNHLNLFGRGYLSSVHEVLRRFA
jgi:protein-ribulosamine 3-kinase